MYEFTKIEWNSLNEISLKYVETIKMYWEKIQPKLIKICLIIAHKRFRWYEIPIMECS